MREHRVAIIGCGAISKVHLEAIRHAGQRLCAVCDILPERAQSLAAHWATDVAVYRDFSELLEREKPDAVHICTPHYLHAPMCIDALRRGIHVLCEKPLCISIGQLNAIRQAEQESKATLGVCLQNRYEPVFAHLKELAEGNILSAMGIVNWKRDEAYYRSGDWRGKWDTEGGGLMINQALHTLDLLQWICGMPQFVTAHCFNDHLPDVIETEDTATAMFEGENGTLLEFFGTTAGGADFPAQLQILTRDRKRYYADAQVLLERDCIVRQQQAQTAVGKCEWGSGHRALVADFYRCLDENRPFPVTAEEGEKVIRLILAMYVSNGKRTAIPV